VGVRRTTSVGQRHQIGVRNNTACDERRSWNIAGMIVGKGSLNCCDKYLVQCWPRISHEISWNWIWD